MVCCVISCRLKYGCCWNCQIWHLLHMTMSISDSCFWSFKINKFHSIHIRTCLGLWNGCRWSFKLNDSGESSITSSNDWTSVILVPQVLHFIPNIWNQVICDYSILCVLLYIRKSNHQLTVYQILSSFALVTHVSEENEDVYIYSFRIYLDLEVVDTNRN